MNKPRSITEYLAELPKEKRALMENLHKLIMHSYAEIETGIGYGMPRYRINGKDYVFFCAFKNHYSIFPFPSGVKEFADMEEKYKTSKGTIQFPYVNEIMMAEITRILNYLLAKLV